MKFLNRLGADAAPVADQVRQMLKSGELSDLEESLQSFLKKVEKGELPGPRVLWL